MSADARITKQPAERLAFTFDYGLWLGEDEAVMSALPVVSGGDLALLADLVVVAPGGREVVTYLDGGTDGQRYRVTLTITTSFGQRKQSELEVRVVDR